MRTLSAVVAILAIAGGAAAADVVPTEIELPGTQPTEVGGFQSPGNCEGCHGGTVNPELEPSFGWSGSMMAQAGRDPLFWATVAIAEQDFLPGADPATRGGAGDLCLRCHAGNGWIGGRSTPTDGSGLVAGDDDGVECEQCHLMVDPDLPINVLGTLEVQNAPYLAHEPTTGEGWYGAGMAVYDGGGTRLGPYADTNARHAVFDSTFFRDGALCGTCHDVSNPAVGDLAPSHGAQVALPPGRFSGVPGAPVSEKAAFLNPPAAYGVVERTYSEWLASSLSTTRVNDFASLPADLRAPGGAIQIAHQRASEARGDADFEDGAPRYFTCQTCHMSAGTGVGCNKNNVPVRTDLGRHDLTGGGYWMPEVVIYQDDRGVLRLGGGLDVGQREALRAGAVRAQAMLASAASLAAVQDEDELDVRITNLTGHKLPSGYPEGRRMWLNVRWLDAAGGLVAEAGGYGPIGRIVRDLSGVDHEVESLLDPDASVVYEVAPGISQAWAASLLGLGYDPGLALAYDRSTDAAVTTLGELAAAPVGAAEHTFRFVLNDVILSDSRVPPYGFAYDLGRTRNALPVPFDRFGAPGPGGTYTHYDDVELAIPAGAASAEVRLFYQQTSWEYIQFLWLANDGMSTFLGQEGERMLDAWLNTGQSPPFEMARIDVTLAPPGATPGEASRADVAGQAMLAVRDRVSGAIDVAYTPACAASDHTIYFGDLADVGGYGYADAACGLGTSGAASFDPGTGSIFFLVIGNDGAVEGSYGIGVAGGERPEAIGIGACDLPQDLSRRCDPR